LPLLNLRVSVLVRLDSEAFKLVRVMIELEASRVLARLGAPLVKSYLASLVKAR
jgi:hypothetical protein